MIFFRKNKCRKFLSVIGIILIVFLIWQIFDKPSMDGDWQEQLEIASIAEFDGDLVTVRNVRNFRYYPEEKDTHPDYYDQQYDMSKVKQVWYTSEPFNENRLAGHTYVTFEFENGDFLAITIEARKRKDQSYSIWKGMLHTYPLIYIASDERDITLLRANLRKDKVYVYPVKLSDSKNGGVLLKNMLTEMNDLLENPRWYNTVFSNCTSEIAKHVNKITPKRISIFSWQLVLTASADELALKHGLLDTELSIKEAREKYNINEASMRVGDSPNYSAEIRKFK
jgi:hypothetical protein